MSSQGSKNIEPTQVFAKSRHQIERGDRGTDPGANTETEQDGDRIPPTAFHCMQHVLNPLEPVIATGIVPVAPPLLGALESLDPGPVGGRGFAVAPGNVITRIHRGDGL